MFRDKISGIAVAATLGTATLLGATNANAVINLDAKDKSKPVVLFSSELVEETGITGVGDNAGKTWHQVTGVANALDIQVKLGHRVLANDIIEVKYELTNMVFGTVSAAAGDFTATGVTMSSPTVPTDLTGKSTATLVFTASTSASEDAAVTWAVGNDAGGVFGIAPGGNGTITATVTNLTVARTGGTAGYMASYPNAVQLGSSLSVGSMSSNLTADVADGFKSFTVDRFATGRTVTGHVGKVFAKLATPAPMSPVDGGTVAIGTILDISSAAASRVTVTGNFGAFLDDTDTASAGVQGGVHLDTAADCGSASGDATYEAVTIGADGEASAVGFSDLQNTILDHYLCLTVDGETAIPVTEAYGAKVEFEQGTNITQTLPSGTHPLGMIGRNGATFHLPYLSTNEKFHQRIRIVNRGGETTYEMAFHGMDDEAGTGADGMLDAKSITVLSLRNGDVVEPGEGSSTSATLSIAAEPGMIDVATVQVNRETGNTDTVVYMAAQ